MAEFDILGGFISPDAIKEFDKLDARVKQSASEIDKLISKMGAMGLNTDYSKDAAKLQVAAARVDAINAESTKKLEILEARKQAAIEKTARARSQATIQEKTDLQTLAAQEKLNAIATSEHATSLQKLQANMKLLEIEMQSKFNPALKEQGQDFRDLNKQHASLQQEYIRTARATGVMGRSMNSSYGSTFQLTQVMRELPNFAIDARVGFMALSNNLPMLADGFKQLKQQIIDTEGAAGAGRKTWAAFGKSLLSLNTIMIVATTLMVLYGDKIVDWAETLFKGEKSVDSFREALLGLHSANAEMYKTMKEGGGVFKTTVESIDKMKSSLENSKGNTKESKYYLDEYNKSLGVTFGKATDVDGALKLIEANQDDYISAMKNMAFANAFFDKSSEDMVKTIEIALKSKNQIVKEAGKDSKAMYDDLATLNKAMEEAKTKGTASFSLKGKGGFLGGSTVTDASVEEIASIRKAQVEKINKIESTERGKQYKAVEDHQKMMLSMAQKFAKKSSDLYDKNGWGFPTDDPKGDKAKKTFTEINVLRVMYDKQRGELVERLANLEDDITKSTLSGELNSYEKRTKAATLYYETVKAMSNADRDIAILNAQSKTLAEKNSLQQKFDNNVRKFGAKSAEAEKSATELKVGNATLEANEADAILKINDEFDKKILDAAKKQQKDLFAVSQDIYADKVYMLEKEKQLELEKVSNAAVLQKSKTNTKSPLELVNAKLGGSSSNALQDLKDAEDANQKKLDIERKALQKEYDLQETSGEKRKELSRKIGENIHSAALSRIKTDQDIEIETAKTIEDAKISIVSSAIDTLTTLWEDYYKFQQDKIDETLKKQTDANEESVKQYEDETDAGMHSSKELSDYKDRIAAYQKSQDEEAARKKKELDKEAFLFKQAMSLAEVWIDFAVNMNKAPELFPWFMATAIAGTVLIAAQTIPAFAEGGTMGKDGKAWVGDGGKNELVMTPTGDWYVTPKVPTVVDMKAGTKIFPDINKLDLNSFLAMAQVQPQMLKTDSLEKEIRGLRSDVRNQKQGNFYGMPLIRQLNNSDRYSARRRGLMN